MVGGSQITLSNLSDAESTTLPLTWWPFDVVDVDEIVKFDIDVAFVDDDDEDGATNSRGRFRDGDCVAAGVDEDGATTAVGNFGIDASSMFFFLKRTLQFLIFKKITHKTH